MGSRVRAVPEWVGKSPDSPIPDRVKVRVFDRHNGICHISGRKIHAGEPWDAEHIIAIINGGSNSESNLAPALRDKHKAKTAQDMAEKAATYRKRKKHLGVRGRKRTMPYRKFDGTIVPSRYK